MAEKVNKSYTSFHYHSLINLCVLYLSCHLAERRAEAFQFMILSSSIYDLSHGVGAKSDTVLPALLMTCVFVPKLRGKCMFEHSFYYIIINL